MLTLWQGDTMYNESLLMVTNDGEHPKASLLFEPIQILSIMNARMDKEYIEGKDWILENGKLVMTENSNIPFMQAKDLYYPKYIPNLTMPRKGGGAVIYREGSFFHDRQIIVCYKHKLNVWNGPKPQFDSVSLAGTISKLEDGKPLKILLYGDSISVGANSSSLSQVPPYLPIWGKLIVSELERKYKSEITFINQSLGGKTSIWGKKQASKLVASHHPDLVIVAFGMNDGAGDGVGDGISPSSFKANIASIISSVRTTNPKTEFILVATTLPNAETFFLDKQPYYYNVLAELAAESFGIRIANMTGVHEELLKYKQFQDMTGNNINHPNDFLSRWYAQFITGFLIPPKS